MQRVLETTELMNDAAQADAYAASDFTGPHEAFVQRFADTFPTFQAGRVADLCCGPADPTIRFARRFPRVRIVGFDGAESMLAHARQAVSQAGLSDRIKLQQRMLPILDYAGKRFHAVICNGSMHHLPDSGILWQTIKNIAMPAAEVFVVDLIRPATMDIVERMVQDHTKPSDPEQMKTDFFHSLRAAFRPEEIRVQLDEAGLSQLRVEVISNRHMMIWGEMG